MAFGAAADGMRLIEAKVESQLRRLESLESSVAALDAQGLKVEDALQDVRARLSGNSQDPSVSPRFDASASPIKAGMTRLEERLQAAERDLELLGRGGGDLALSASLRAVELTLSKHTEEFKKVSMSELTLRSEVARLEERLCSQSTAGDAALSDTVSNVQDALLKVSKELAHQQRRLDAISESKIQNELLERLAGEDLARSRLDEERDIFQHVCQGLDRQGLPDDVRRRVMELHARLADIASSRSEIPSRAFASSTGSESVASVRTRGPGSASSGSQGGRSPQGSCRHPLGSVGMSPTHSMNSAGREAIATDEVDRSLERRLTGSETSRLRSVSGSRERMRMIATTGPSSIGVPPGSGRCDAPLTRAAIGRGFGASPSAHSLSARPRRPEDHNASCAQS